MKALILITAALAGLSASSCRTACPLDPLTMRPDCSRCRIPADPSSCHHPGCTTTTTEEIHFSSK